MVIESKTATTGQLVGRLWTAGHHLSPIIGRTFVGLFTVCCKAVFYLVVLPQPHHFVGQLEINPLQPQVLSC